MLRLNTAKPRYSSLDQSLDPQAPKKTIQKYKIYIVIRVVYDLEAVSFLEGQIVGSPGFIVVQGHKKGYPTWKPGRDGGRSQRLR